MKRKTFTSTTKPETILQTKIMDFLTLRGWYWMNMHGSMFQSGFPDIYATHSLYKQRLIEVKIKHQYHFTPAQVEKFPKLSANGSPIWILVAATEQEYQKLFGPENWFQYLKW